MKFFNVPNYCHLKIIILSHFNFTYTLWKLFSSEVLSTISEFDSSLRSVKFKYSTLNMNSTFSFHYEKSLPLRTRIDKTLYDNLSGKKLIVLRYSSLY